MSTIGQQFRANVANPGRWLGMPGGVGNPIRIEPVQNLLLSSDSERMGIIHSLPLLYTKVDRIFLPKAGFAVRVREERQVSRDENTAVFLCQRRNIADWVGGQVAKQRQSVKNLVKAIWP